MDLIEHDWLKQIHPDWLEAQKLHIEISDNEREPYQHKYKAREYYFQLRKAVEHRQANGDKNERKRLDAMMKALDLQLGLVCMDVDELPAALEHLELSIEKGTEGDQALWLYTHISALNQLGILWVQRGDAVKARDNLEKSQSLFHSYKSGGSSPPFLTKDLFDSDKVTDSQAAQENCQEVEKLHTYTLYYLAQVYGNLELPHLSASYCHQTLSRQLSDPNMDSVDWALNAATLAQYYISKDAFSTARHHLSAASCILSKYEEQKQKKNQDDSEEEGMEQLKHRKADVARCWSKYGLRLLAASKDRLLRLTDEEEVESFFFEEEEAFTSLRFHGLELSTYKDHIGYRPLRDFDDARNTFLSIQKWITEAQTYYCLEDHASDNVETVQDLSQAYHLLAFFEDDVARQCRMHKRRIVLLQTILDELNPTFYLLVCRQLRFELAEVHVELMGLKTQQMQDKGGIPDPKTLAKVFRLVQEAIDHFQSFVGSYYEQSKLPDPLPEENVRPVLVAFFHVGRLYGKFHTADPSRKQEQLQKSKDAFQFVVDYCDKYPSAKEVMSAELGICRDMAELLPCKIDIVAAQARQQSE